MGETNMRRYTNLGSLFHIVQRGALTLLDPERWDDRNDVFFMGEYKRRKRARTVLALCLAKSEERYHHWKVFAHGSDGVCLEFNESLLLAAICPS